MSNDVVTQAQQKIEAAKAISDPFDFLNGMADCRDGEDHKPGRSESYDRGYNCQYQWEQIVGARHG